MNPIQSQRTRRPRSSRGSISLVLALSLIAASTSFQPSSRSSISRHNPTSSSPSQFVSQRKIRTSPRYDATSLNAITPAAALSAVASPLGSIAVLAFVILVHESGHFIAARSLGMNVDEFSVGVGPRIVGVRRRLVDDKFVFEKINDSPTEEEKAQTNYDGIEFSLRALPLGGYVRFPENYNRTLAFEQEDAARMARNEARLMRVQGASTLEKALETLAARSTILNVLTLGLLKSWSSKREEEQLRQAEVDAEMGALRMGKSKGNKNWWSALPWVAKKDEKEELNGNDKLAILKATKAPETEYFDDPNLLQNRPWQERAIVLSGGVVFNILLAFSCFFGELTGGKGLPSPVFDSGAVVSQMPGKDSPSFGLLKRGDIIVGVNDVITFAPNSKPSIYSSQKQISNTISTIRETPEGEIVKLTIIHGRNSESTDVVSVSPKRNDEGLVSIGVMLGPNYLRTDMVQATSVFDAASKAGSAVYEITSETARSIIGLLLGFLFGNGLPAGTSMSGPIGVVKTGAAIVSKSDFSAVVAFAASISVNLAVVNALPLPALDGGQLAFVLAEAAAGRRIDQRVQEGINAGALLILVIISFGTAVGDVTSIFR
mmetsp:Transcript_28596/g.51694  ORF Transcript_28596/g.51694 Transcript_28596/m.51694 type:complete len:603 (-) Transcript_28596:109-1917(-)|eukprot:CAMPEP_0201941420 /NCGR_PEP_ID=MMETSP0903-20130614/47094_1 /ASSEMBLY_ACC=CAM_ASM_000552 /TAXON_ID=420261 /ORGANISM="Thalassiosira antarctica, Strain CCMP982" /LENGTH=602 /DNA_ID=CAMNT_0048483479 /DNA_START=85 /DNA_END=1893 /DNA_ORIENTATION=-